MINTMIKTGKIELDKPNIVYPNNKINCDIIERLKELVDDPKTKNKGLKFFASTLMIEFNIE